MPKRSEKALRAGLVTLLLGLLCTATFALPELATHPDFGHHHAKGTPEHVHPLNLLLGGGLPLVISTDGPVDLEVAPYPAPVTSSYVAELEPGFLSRAPPSLERPRVS